MLLRRRIVKVYSRPDICQNTYYELHRASYLATAAIVEALYGGEKHALLRKADRCVPRKKREERVREARGIEGRASRKKRGYQGKETTFEMKRKRKRERETRRELVAHYTVHGSSIESLITSSVSRLAHQPGSTSQGYLTKAHVHSYTWISPQIHIHIYTYITMKQ